MTPIRLRNLKGLDRATRKKIRDALRTTSRDTSPRDSVLDSRESTSKWRNVRTTVDGITFASQREANRYAELKLESVAGDIMDLQLQKPYSLDVNGIHIGDYVADFVYQRNSMQIVEDAKGKATAEYKIKRALMRAIHGITIVEV